jgi:hypothetical protein
MVRAVDRKATIAGIAGVRLAVGVGAWATPHLASRLFGLDVEGNPQAPYLARLFGVRDAALAWGVLNSEGDAQRRWLMAGLVCDVGDALAGIAGGRAGYLPKLTTVLVTGTAIAGVALGASALSEP